MKKIFVLLVATVVVTNLNAQPKFRNLADATKGLQVAMLNGDNKILDQLVDGSLSYGHSSGRIEDKAGFVNSLTSGMSDFVTLDISNQTINEYKRSAVVRHTLQGDTKDNGVAGKVKLHVMQVWVKRSGGWKLVARQAVKIL